jgi:surface polysaccharide O-acyltransferase-like enzyme
MLEMNASAAKTSTPRLYYLDWLRVIATIGIFLFHNSRAYDYGDWSIKNAQTTLGATQFVEFMNIWMMPLFFVLSGASVYYSLKSRNGGSFLKERFFRIMVPWLLTGIFVMAPPQVYLERLSHGQFDGNFFQFLPHYFNGIYGFGGNFAFHGMHIWYLMQLSVFSVILLPFFLPRARTGVSPAQSIAAKLGKSWMLPLLFVPVGIAALLSSAVGLAFTEQMGSWDILSYMMFFILGYMIFASDGIQQAIRKQGGWFLAAAAVFSATHILLKFYVRPVFYDDIDMRLLATWGWIVGLLWLGRRLLNFTNRFLAHVSEMVLPFYILHQTVIIFVAYFVVQTGLAIPLKYGINVVISFAAIVVLYELLVSRVGVFRFLFGMKRKAVPRVSAPKVVAISPSEPRL